MQRTLESASGARKERKQAIMAITIQERRIRLGEAPALLVYSRSPEENSSQGTILFYHGMGGSKDDESGPAHFLPRALARAGFLVVSIDLVGHGERRYSDFEYRFLHERRVLAPEDAEREFLTVVQETAREVPHILNELTELNWINPEAIGVAGWSMGAYVVYRAVVVDRRIRVATPIAGSPEWYLNWPDSPHLFPDRFFPVALLSQNAENDTTVRSHYARDFHRQMEMFYRSKPERLCYMEHLDADHEMSHEVGRSIVKNMIMWFQRFLAQKSSFTEKM